LLLPTEVSEGIDSSPLLLIPVMRTLYCHVTCYVLLPVETVLLASQSTAELEAKLQDPSVVVVVSLAPQSRAALAGEEE
jgi:iron only hydrogenase large subunit-like protein